MEGLRQVFIANLKRYRKQNHIRQLDLAMEIGKSANYINSIENGKYFPSPETIEKIAEILKVEPASLFQKEDNVKLPPKEELVNRVYDKVIVSLTDLIRTTVNSELDTSAS
ncbi:MAG: helix-turn-helix domain-containing protein [Treponema sp.]|nr:helix-turn-helix domain-containing protein [Treponema sp.]